MYNTMALLASRLPWDVYIYVEETASGLPWDVYIYVRVIHRIFLLLLLAGSIPLCTNQKVRYLLC